jgi:hypothetical protein
MSDEKSSSSKTNVLRVDTPQRDSDWPEERKIEWVKKYTAHVLAVLNQRDWPKD